MSQKKNITKSKNSRKYKNISRDEKRKFANEFLKHDNNATEAYLSIRPDVKRQVAMNQGSKLIRDTLVKVELNAALEKNNVTPDYIIQGYKTALESGLGKKATNSDAIKALQELAKLSQLDQKDEIEALQRADLESLSHKELLSQLDQIQQDIHQLRREGAIDADIIDP